MNKYLKLSGVAAISMVVLAIACFKVFSLSIKYNNSQIDNQLNLLAEHKEIYKLRLQINQDREFSHTDQSLHLPALQQLSISGVLFLSSYSAQNNSWNWIANNNESFKYSAPDQKIIARIIERSEQKSAFFITINGEYFRVKSFPGKQSNNPDMILLARLNGVFNAFGVFLFWIFVVVMAISGMIYCVHVLIYQNRKSRWIARIKNEKKDHLTGLPNQQQLIWDLDRTKNTNLAFIKIHDFNSILNTYGPAISDDVIKQISTVIANFEHPKLIKPCCYHVQQELFAILEDQKINFDEIGDITKELVKSITNTKYQVGDGDYISINVTIGATRKNRDAFMLANMALQEAEKKKLQFYLIDDRDSWLPETYKRDLALTQVLLAGIKEKRLVAFYQPIFKASDKTVEKYECLARLMDEQGEIQLMPNVFIPLAHRANVYYLITQIMIKHAVEFAHTNRVVVSLNLSISDIHNKRTCDYLFEKLRASGVGHLMQFELLENEAIIESEEIIEFIKKLQQFGCKVGMDDLGKGHSNIERLVNLPIDFVKIDRTIMENVTQNLEMQNVARGIVKLAHKKGLNVVAEYCSDHLLTSIAVDLGVDSLQGFYLGIPSQSLFATSEQLKKSNSNI